MPRATEKPHAYRLMGQWLVVQEQAMGRRLQGSGDTVREACAAFVDVQGQPWFPAFRSNSLGTYGTVASTAACAPAPAPSGGWR